MPTNIYDRTQPYRTNILGQIGRLKQAARELVPAQRSQTHEEQVIRVLLAVGEGFNLLSMVAKAGGDFENFILTLELRETDRTVINELKGALKKLDDSHVSRHLGDDYDEARVVATMKTATMDSLDATLDASLIPGLKERRAEFEKTIDDVVRNVVKNAKQYYDALEMWRIERDSDFIKYGVSAEVPVEQQQCEERYYYDKDTHNNLDQEPPRGRGAGPASKR